MYDYSVAVLRRYQLYCFEFYYDRGIFIAQNVKKRELELQKKEASLNYDSRYIIIIIQQLSCSIHATCIIIMLSSFLYSSSTQKLSTTSEMLSVPTMLSCEHNERNSRIRKMESFLSPCAFNQLVITAKKHVSEHVHHNYQCLYC